MNEASVMITTFDNPYNPFTHFNEWFMFDVEKGYYTCNYLARIVNLSDDMTEKEVLAGIDYEVYSVTDEERRNPIKLDKNTVWGTSYDDVYRTQSYEPTYILQYETVDKNVGAIMKVVMPKLKGKADGKLINKVVSDIIKGA